MFTIVINNAYIRYGNFDKFFWAISNPTLDGYVVGTQFYNQLNCTRYHTAHVITVFSTYGDNMTCNMMYLNIERDSIIIIHFFIMSGASA